MTKKRYATPVWGIVVVAGVYRAPDGVRSLTVNLGEDAFEDFQKLPDVVSYEGRLYGKTGFNSDTGLAYYKDDVRLATPVEVSPARICEYQSCDGDPLPGSDFCEGHQKRTDPISDPRAAFEGD